MVDHVQSQRTCCAITPAMQFAPLGNLLRIPDKEWTGVSAAAAGGSDAVHLRSTDCGEEECDRAESHWEAESAGRACERAEGSTTCLACGVGAQLPSCEQSDSSEYTYGQGFCSNVRQPSARVCLALQEVGSRHSSLMPTRGPILRQTGIGTT